MGINLNWNYIVKQNINSIDTKSRFGVVRSRTDRNGDGVCDIIYPINLKEDEQKGLDGNGGVFSYITDIRRWLRTDCTDSA